MQLNKFLDVKPEVAEAIAAGKPVVALESTIISHGMPYPQNVQTALEVERIIRENGAVPATIAIIGGRLKAGLTAEEIEYFGKKGTAIAKASRRDLAVLCARGEDGATTVTTTMIIAHMVPASRCSPPAASAACIAVPRRPWTSPPTSKSWPPRPLWSSAPVQSPFWTSA